MGKAFLGPDNGTLPTYHVSDHALVRLRERVKAKVILPDMDSFSLISEAVVHAKNMGLTRDVIDGKRENAFLADITTTLDETLAVAAGGAHALVKKDSEGRRDIVVTILPTHMAQKMRDRPSPQVPRSRPPGNPFNPVLKLGYFGG